MWGRGNRVREEWGWGEGEPDADASGWSNTPSLTLRARKRGAPHSEGVEGVADDGAFVVGLGAGGAVALEVQGVEWAAAVRAGEVEAADDGFLGPVGVFGFVVLVAVEEGLGAVAGEDAFEREVGRAALGAGEQGGRVGAKARPRQPGQIVTAPRTVQRGGRAGSGIGHRER